jgi:hypothetical protein
MTYPSLDDRFQAASERFDSYAHKRQNDFTASQYERAAECATLLRRLKRSCAEILERSSKFLELARESGILVTHADMFREVNRLRETDTDFAKQIAHLGSELRVVNSDAIRLATLDYSSEDEKNLSADERAQLYDLVEKTAAYYEAAHRLLKALQKLPGFGKRFNSAPVRAVRNDLLVHHDGTKSKVMTNSFGISESRGPVVKPSRTADEARIPQDGGLVPNTTALLDDVARRLEHVEKAAGSGTDPN